MLEEAGQYAGGSEGGVRAEVGICIGKNWWQRWEIGHIQKGWSKKYKENRSQVSYCQKKNERKAK